ncbi:MAG: hypothetical protein ABJ370_11600 [Paracoccaceae bacterium]
MKSIESPKSKLAGTLLAPERHAQLKAAAKSEGLSVSKYLGRLVDLVLEDVLLASDRSYVPTKARREGKVRNRLSALMLPADSYLPYSLLGDLQTSKNVPSRLSSGLVSRELAKASGFQS